jgi:hypothetical protein
MSKLRDILLNERRLILERITPLTADVRRLREELWLKQNKLSKDNAELEKVNSTLKMLDATEARSSVPTIMEAVLEVLKDHEEGMTALEILAEINTRYFGGKIVRSSLSPQLSRLKDKKKTIRLRGNRWFAVSAEPTLFGPNK